MTRARCLGLAGVLLLSAGCGGPESEPAGDATSSTSAPTTSTAGASQPGDPNSPSTRADAYAKQKSGGETLGCTSAEPGPEAEAHPGCIYAAAFSGCHEGITGEQLGPAPAEEEFAQEPKLVEIHRQAVEDCRA